MTSQRSPGTGCWVTVYPESTTTAGLAYFALRGGLGRGERCGKAVVSHNLCEFHLSERVRLLGKS